MPGSRPLDESGCQFDAAIRMTRIGTFSLRLDTDELWWSDTLFHLHQLDPATVQLSRALHTEFVLADDRPLAIDALARLMSTGDPVEEILRVRRRDGMLRYFRTWMNLERDRAGRPIVIRGAVQDVTDEREALSALRAGREQLRLAFDEAPIAMLMMTVLPDGSWQAVRMNDALRALVTEPGRPGSLGSAPHLPEHDLRWIHPDDVPAVRAAIWRLLERKAPHNLSFETRLRARSGRYLHTWVHACITDDAEAEAEAEAERTVLFHIMDVTEQQKTAEALSRQALTDTVTGLGNRTRFEQTLRQRLRYVRPGRRALGLLLLDLDRFKVVNDSLGHQTGDRLLAEVSGRLTAAADPDWLICRLGGDEFAIVIDDAPDSGALLHVATELGERLARPYSLPGQIGLVCTASIGITRCEDPAGTEEDLYREADLALYAAKDAGRDTATLFDDTLRARADHRIRAENRLRAALAAGGVRMYLQPVVDLAGEQVVGAEALARLEHPQEGLLLPADFVEVAEDTGLILQIDAAVTELAIAHLARPEVDPALRVAVNVSPHTLEQPEYLRRLAEALERHRLDRNRLLIEVTESSLLDLHGPRAEGLNRLRELKLTIGIDDFGTGYSALAYLSRFALDFLKIDRSFVARLGTGTEPDTLVAAIIGLAHAHGMVVVAEGVETREQVILLREMGCDRAQGYLFGRPAPPPRR